MKGEVVSEMTLTNLFSITLHGLVSLENLLAVFFVADGEEGCAFDWCHFLDLVLFCFVMSFLYGL